MTEPSPPGERIAKLLSRAGIASRREAERMIEAGRVRVNGAVITSPALNVTASDRVEVDGKPVGAPEPPRLWLYHKPAGLVTTERDEKGRPTVFSALPDDLPRVMSVGRLDLTTEGLLLLTNDGELARFLELPATGWKRRYRVRVHGKIDQAGLDRLAGGIVIDGVRYGPVQARLDNAKGTNAWITLTLSEGKNREVRRLMQHLDLQVTRLIRTAYGPFQLGDLPRGEVKAVPRRVLRDQLGANAVRFGLTGREPDADHRRKA